MRWTSGLGTHEDLEASLDQAAEHLDRAADLVICFASPAYPADALLSGLRRRFPNAILTGASAAGVIAGGVEVEHKTALSVTAASLPDVQLSFVDAARPEVPSDSVGVLLLSDPYASIEEILASLDRATAAPVFGGIASGGKGRGDLRLFRNDEVLPGGAIALSFSGRLRIETLVAQGCKPVGEPLLVLRADGQTIFEFDRGSPVDVLRDLPNLLSPADQQLMRSALFLGIQMRDQRGVYEAGDFLIRNLIGVNPKRRSLAVATHIEGHPVVQFHLRDAQTSHADLMRQLGLRTPANESEGILVFSCLGRGAGLYGHANHDSELIRDAWFRGRRGPPPTAGFFCNGEIGPVAGRTFLHGYTCSIARFSPV